MGKGLESIVARAGISVVQRRVDVFRRRIYLTVTDGTEVCRQNIRERVVKEEITHHDAVPLSLLDLLAVQSEMIWFFVQGECNDGDLA